MRTKAYDPPMLFLSFIAMSPHKVSQCYNTLEGLSVEKPHRSPAQFLVFPKLVERDSHTLNERRVHSSQCTMQIDVI